MVFIKRAKRYAKGVVKRGVKMAKKRYMTKKGPNIKNIYNDVAMLKHLVNIEKKRFDFTLQNSVSFAQSNTVGVSGQYAISLSPNTMSEGVAQGQRIGQSIKLVSGYLSMQIQQQVNTVNDLKIKWYVVCRPDNSALSSNATSIAQFFEPNPFSGVNDYYSSRDPEYFGAFRIIRTGIVELKQDQITSGTSIVQKNIPLKLDLHQKYNTDTVSPTVKNNVMLFLVCSGGDVALSSGATIVYNMRWYYTDN